MKKKASELFPSDKIVVTAALMEKLGITWIDGMEVEVLSPGYEDRYKKMAEYAVKLDDWNDELQAERDALESLLAEAVELLNRMDDDNESCPFCGVSITIHTPYCRLASWLKKVKLDSVR